METNLGRVRGSMWYAGTGITGTSTTPIVFSDSGVTKAYTLDKYLNTDTGNVYECVTAGEADTAEWVYTGCIQGPMPEVVNSLTSSSTTKALSAAQGKVLNDRIAGAGLYPYGVIPKSEQTAYTAQVTIENKSTVLTFKDNADNTGTHTYSKVGDADTAVVNVSIGTTIGFPSSGAVITSIGSSEAVIYNFKLFDNDSQVIYEATPNIWDGINSNDADVKAGGTVSETYNGTTVNYRDGIISKLIDGVRTALYPITHAKATWFNKQANKTVYDAVTDIMGSTDVFSPTKNYAAGDYTIYQSAVYRFKTAHTGAWNASHVTKISLSQLNTDLSAITHYQLYEHMSSDNTGLVYIGRYYDDYPISAMCGAGEWIEITFCSVYMDGIIAYGARLRRQDGSPVANQTDLAFGVLWGKAMS